MTSTSGSFEMAILPIELTRFHVVELSIRIEFVQYPVVQLLIQGETIPMTPEQTVNLINLLAQKRTELHLSVNEVARRAKVDTGTVWRIEQGMIAQPRADSLIAIGNVLGINPMDLFLTAGWLTDDDLPALGTYLSAKFKQLPVAAVEDIEHYVANVLQPSSDGSNRNHHAAHADQCPRTADHCPQCPCSPKESRHEP